MKKNKRKINSENHLEKIPVRPNHIGWTYDDCMVVLLIENKGIVKKLTQTFFDKPKISYVHLDELGSFIWLLMDGEKNIIEIADCVKAQFGEKADPLYQRIIAFFRILESYGFVAWNNQ